MINLIPVYGLCNRLRAIASCLEIFEGKSKINIYWQVNKDLGCKWEDLFCPIKNVNITNCKEEHFLYRPGRKDNFYLPSLIRSVGSSFIWNEHKTSRYSQKDFNYGLYKKIPIPFYLKAYNWLNQGLPNYSFLKPNEVIQNSIATEISKFSEKTIGFHLRRKDNKDSINLSPDQLFLDMASKLLTKYPYSKIYLASDELKVKRKFVNEFGNRIITNLDEVKRHDIEGMQQAAIDLFTLSKTDCIYGSYWSSYSETAAYIGGKSLTVLKT